jgi:hypothetical protein
MNRAVFEIRRNSEFPDHRHIEFEQHGEQRHLRACFDDLTHDGKVEGAQ